MSKSLFSKPWLHNTCDTCYKSFNGKFMALIRRSSLLLSMERRLTQMPPSGACLVVLLIKKGRVLCSGAPTATHWLPLALATGDKDLVALVSEHAFYMNLSVKLVVTTTIVHHHYSVDHILHLILTKAFFKIHILKKYSYGTFKHWQKYCC